MRTNRRMLVVRIFRRGRAVLGVTLWLAAVCGAAVFANAAQLPQDHEYQRVLRDYMATLTEKDFDHGLGDKPQLTTLPDTRDQEAQYRSLMLTQMNPPMIGSKRGTTAINLPTRFFTLQEIEGSEQGIRTPRIDSDSLISFTHWDYAGNVLHNSRALKMRAFVNAAIQMMMADQHLDANPTLGRADWHAYQLVYFGFPYAGFKDVLPPEVQAAYSTGMERYARRILDWGIRGEEPNMDLIAAAALWYAYDASQDDALRERIENHIKTIFADPQYFHPAGYWVERGGMDLGFAGMANFFANWAALKSNRDYANDAIERLYRLRAHLILTEPDGSKVGPTQFNNRLGSDPHGDQWAWDGARDYAASQITDEAAHLVRPTREDLAQAAAHRAGSFSGQIRENPIHGEKTKATGANVHRTSDELLSQPWQFRMWYNWDYPVTLNPGYDHYRAGSWARREALEKAKSPMLKSPFERGERFVRNFADAFIVAHQSGYTAIVHTGPVGRQNPEEQNFQFHAPLGFGGGQLAAFSTPKAGAVLLGRRAGQNWNKPFDLVAEWRTWPIHAVSGEKVDGTVFTSARIADPKVTTDLNDKGGTVTVSGPLTALKTVKDPSAEDPAKARDLLYDDTLTGEIGYARTFTFNPDGVTVATTLTGDGKDTIAELYETLPVFHRRDHLQELPVATVTFLVGKDWIDATDQSQKDVGALRIRRFDGTVEIEFDKPQTVKLSPAEWRDTHMTRALGRTVLIDRLDTGGKPGSVDGKQTLTYTITPR